MKLFFEETDFIPNDSNNLIASYINFENPDYFKDLKERMGNIEKRMAELDKGMTELGKGMKKGMTELEEKIDKKIE